MALLIAGCESNPTVESPTPTATVPVRDTAPAPQLEDPRSFLTTAARGPAGDPARLRAALLYADQGEMIVAAGVLQQIDPGQLAARHRALFHRLRAAIALHRGDPAGASHLLRLADATPTDSAPDGTESRFTSLLRARVLSARGDLLAAARERVFVDPLLDREDATHNRTRIWELLTALDAPLLDAAIARNTGSETLHGWLELAQIASSMYPTLEAQQADLVSWHSRWSDHPAAAAMPERLARIPALMADRPRRVAVLLPLSGPLASAGSAVRNGILTAHLEAVNAGGYTPELSFLDTAAAGALSAYHVALDAGADLVIGPLTKPDVDAVALAMHAEVPVAEVPVAEVPVLALNTSSDGRVPRGMLQFALLPEDEGLQLAERIVEDGFTRALLLAGGASWAERIQESFAYRFEALGGELVRDARFTTSGTIREAVADALLVAGSEQRADALRRLIGQPIEFEPRRRADIEVVVAITDAASAGTLKPALDYYFAGDLPLYATSHAHEPSAASAADQPMRGMRFCDMPWRLQPLAERNRTRSAWPDLPAATSAFHALGVDAWRLHAHLPALREPGSRFQGVTGELVLTPEGRFQRRLQWAVMQTTGPLPLPRVVRYGP